MSFETLVTPKARIGFSSLFEPKTSQFDPNGKPKYTAQLLFDSAALKSPAGRAMLKAIQDRGEKEWGADYTPMVKNGQIHLPIRTDVGGKGWPPDVAAFASLKSDYKPLVVDTVPLPVMDPGVVYPGCWVRASFTIFHYRNKPGNGISLGLTNIQWLDAGPRLASARPDGSEFGKFSDKELEDLIG